MGTLYVRSDFSIKRMNKAVKKMQFSTFNAFSTLMDLWKEGDTE